MTHKRSDDHQDDQAKRDGRFADDGCPTCARRREKHRLKMADIRKRQRAERAAAECAPPQKQVAS